MNGASHEQTPITNKNRQPLRWQAKAMRVIGAVGATTMAAASISTAFEITSPETSTQIVWVDSKEVCENRDAVMVYGSSTGIDTSVWAAEKSSEFAEEFSVCRIAAKTGKRVNIELAAMELASELDSVYGKREVYLGYIGMSAGGIEVQAIASNDWMKNRKNYKQEVVYLESSPHDADDIRFVPAREFAKTVPADFTFPRLLFFIMNLAGQFQRGDMVTPKAYEDSYRNAIINDPTQVIEKLRLIKQGFPEGGVATKYILAYSEKDIVIDQAAAPQKIIESIGSKEYEILNIPDSGLPGDPHHSMSAFREYFDSSYKTLHRYTYSELRALAKKDKELKKLIERGKIR